MAVSSLLRERALTPDRIKDRAKTCGLPESAPPLLNDAVKLSKSYRAHGHLGRLRASVLLGVTLCGPEFIKLTERAGLFLCDPASAKKFGAFLADLKHEVERASADVWSTLAARLETYLAYQQLVVASTPDERKVFRLLRVRPRLWVKEAIAVAALAFLRDSFNFNPPPETEELLDRFNSPEDVASAVSVLVARANDLLPLDSFDLALPAIEKLNTNELQTLMVYGKALMLQQETAKYLSLFGYTLEFHDSGSESTFYICPPSQDFERSLRLGFIRAEMSRSGRAQWKNTPETKLPMSMLQAGEAVASKLGIVELADDGTPFRRTRLRVPAIPSLLERIVKSRFYEDLLYEEQQGHEFLVPLAHGHQHDLPLRGSLNADCFLRMWKLLRFICATDIAALRPYQRSDWTVILNSLVRVMRERDMVDMIVSTGVSHDQAQEFLSLVCADVEHLGYFDLQYRPLLRIATTTLPERGFTTPREIIQIPVLVYLSNELRNVQMANKVRFASNPQAFVDAVANELRRHFTRVTVNRPVKLGTRSTDIDVVAFEGDTLYFFECKHSVAAAGPHELRDLWEDIEKGAQQLRFAKAALEDPKRACDYLTSWFPGTAPNATTNVVIKPCVLSSHPLFSGIQHEGIPLRDFASLAKLTADGSVGMGFVSDSGELVMHRYRLTQQDKFTSADLDDYLSEEPKYFKMLVAFMRPLSRLDRIGKVTVARETFVYEIGLHEWLSHMNALGFARLPDERLTTGKLDMEGDLVSHTG